MPTNTRNVKITFPVTERLADLYSIESDLVIAEQISKDAIRLDDSGHDSHIVDAIISSAITRYCRCFNTGIRISLKLSDLTQLSKDDIELHKFFDALRDKFIAHSVNPFEESYVNACVVEVDGIPQPITSISAGSTRVLLSKFEAVSLLDLIAKVRPLISKLIQDEANEVMSYIRSIPKETIHAGDSHTPTKLQRGDVFKARAQRNSNTRK